MSEEFERASRALAIQVEQLVADSDAAIVVKALCWVLADLAIQASRTGDSSVDQALRLTTEALIFCTAQLATEGLQEPGRIQ